MQPKQRRQAALRQVAPVILLNSRNTNAVLAA